VAAKRLGGCEKDLGRVGEVAQAIAQLDQEPLVVGRVPKGRSCARTNDSWVGLGAEGV
jgi:hypothetical protein